MQVKKIFDTTRAEQEEITVLQKLLDVHEYLEKLVRNNCLSDDEFRQVDGLVHQTEKESNIIHLKHFNKRDRKFVDGLIRENHYYFRSIHPETHDTNETSKLAVMIMLLKYHLTFAE